MKFYLAGKITGCKDFKERFESAQVKLVNEGHFVLNPAILPSRFEQEEYLSICFAMIDVCDSIYFLSNWVDSPGAKREMEYARKCNKNIYFE